MDTGRVVASQPMVSLGCWTSRPPEKAALRPLLRCFNLPLVVFEDVRFPAGWTRTRRHHRAGAKLLYAFCEATVLA